MEMSRQLRLVFTIITLFFHGAIAQDTPLLTQIDRVRLAEVFRLGNSLSDSVWENWSSAPFAVLLVTPSYEFLLRHPSPSSDFTSTGFDSTLDTEVFFRKRTLRADLLATFPAVNGILTIVVGQAENTMAKSSTAWVITLLHEHFHQLQQSRPGYYDDVNALGLSGGDQTGMWMLNYPFPYDSLAIDREFQMLCSLLAEVQRVDGGPGFEQRARAYLAARKRFNEILSPNDYRYLSFQLWQEGVARYTEIKVAEAAARSLPTPEFRALSDFVPYQQHADSLREAILRDLPALSLVRNRRTVVYSFGAAEALLLDRLQPNWRSRYFREKFFLDRYFFK